MLSCGRLSDPETAAEKNELQEPNGQQVLLSITLRTFMLQCEGQSFKCIFLSISTMCRGWLQEGGMGFGTDLLVSHASSIDKESPSRQGRRDVREKSPKGKEVLHLVTLHLMTASFHSPLVASYFS